MKSMKAKIDFILDGKMYKIGKEIKTKNIKTIIMLNEKGFIEPLTIKEIQKIIEEKNK